MKKTVKGKIIKGVGGLYTVLVNADEAELGGETVRSRARGALRHSGETPLAGDSVTLEYDADKVEAKRKDDEASFVIESINERRNALIRPPLANLDYLYITMAAASPAPVLLTVDKLFSICVYNGIEPIAVISKCELDREYADRLAELYRKAGFSAIVTSSETGEGIDELRRSIDSLPAGSISAFSGASGVGKSTLLNKLFPHLELGTGGLSRKTERGRHTTRAVTLYPIGEDAYLADTPGFSMLDFDRFDFFSLDDLPLAFREINERIGQCKYTKCTHRKEEGCAICDAVKSGEIAKSRHESYVMLYDILKNKHKWDK